MTAPFATATPPIRLLLFISMPAPHYRAPKPGSNPSKSLTQNTPNNVLEASGFFLNLSVTSQLEKRFVDAKSLYEIDLV